MLNTKTNSKINIEMLRNESTRDWKTIHAVQSVWENYVLYEIMEIESFNQRYIAWGTMLCAKIKYFKFLFSSCLSRYIKFNKSYQQNSSRKKIYITLKSLQKLNIYWNINPIRIMSFCKKQKKIWRCWDLQFKCPDVEALRRKRRVWKPDTEIGFVLIFSAQFLGTSVSS